MFLKLAGLIAALLVPIFLSGCTGKTKNAPPQKPEQVVINVGQGGFNPVQIYRRNAPGVVTVIVTRPGGGAGQGSGFLVSSKGEFVTNAHVIVGERGREKPKGARIYLEFQSGIKFPARILALDPDSDLAVLKSNVPKGIRPLVLSNRSTLLPGEPVAAIGSPFGASQSLSTGIISAVDRTVRSLTDFSIENAIQTDASINPGNSGGPLIDSRGQVIGVNQQIQTTSGGNEGVGYAIPIEALDYVLKSVKRGERDVRYAYLGVASQDTWPALSRRLKIPIRGVLLARVEKGTPAFKAGLRGGNRQVTYQGSPVVTGGDVILRLDQTKVNVPADIAEFILDKRPGDRVRVIYFSKGKIKQTEVVFSKRP